MAATGPEIKSGPEVLGMSPGTEGAQLGTWVEAVWAFNGTAECLFQEERPAPEGVRPLVYIVDRSGSMSSHKRELAMVSAAFLKGTNAEGKVCVPGIAGTTAMVGCLQSLEPRLAHCDVIIFTDGYENQFSGKLLVAPPDAPDAPDAGGEPLEVELDSADAKQPGYLAAVCAYVVRVCGHQIYFVGLGADSQGMAEHMIKRRNCYVARIDRGASVAEVVGTVGALRRRAAVTRAPQERLLVTVSDEVRAAIAALAPGEVEAVERVAATVRCASAGEPLPPAPITADELKRAVEAAEEAHAAFVPAGKDTKLARAALLFALEAMCEGPVPGALIGSRHKGIFADTGEWSRFLNKMMASLKAAKILARRGDTPAEGASIQLDGETIDMPGKAVTYECLAPLDVAREVAADEGWLAPRSALKRKRA